MKNSLKNISFNFLSQHGTAWCIPAGIENLLKALNISEISQETLIDAFLRKRNIPLEDNAGNHIPANNLPKHQLLEEFRCKALPDANFKTFKEILDEILSQKNIDLKLEIIDGITSQSDYIKFVKESIDNNQPLLISSKSLGGWHITFAFEYDEDILKTFDPAQDKMIDKKFNDYTFSHDILRLVRK